MVVVVKYLGTLHRVSVVHEWNEENKTEYK